MHIDLLYALNTPRHGALHQIFYGVPYIADRAPYHGQVESRDHTNVLFAPQKCCHIAGRGAHGVCKHQNAWRGLACRS